MSTYTQSLRYDFDWNENWRIINVPLCQAEIDFSLMQKRIFHDFSEKSSTFSTAN